MKSFSFIDNGSPVNAGTVLSPTIFLATNLETLNHDRMDVQELIVRIMFSEFSLIRESLTATIVEYLFIAVSTSTSPKLFPRASSPRIMF